MTAQAVPASRYFRDLPKYFTDSAAASESGTAANIPLVKAADFAGQPYLWRGSWYARLATVDEHSDCVFRYVAHGPVSHLPHLEKGLVPGAVTVTNPIPAIGGKDPENSGEVLRDSAAGLRTPRRVVRAEDYTGLVQESVPGLAKIVPLACARRTGATDASCSACQQGQDCDLRLLLMPSLPTGTIPTAATLTPSPGLYEAARARLQALRPLGTRIRLTRPAAVRYHVTVEVITHAPPEHHHEMREAIRAALTAALHPVPGPGARRGWPLGQSPTEGDIAAALEPLADLITPTRTEVTALDSSPTEPVFLPVLEVLDVTINGTKQGDSLRLLPSDPTLAAAIGSAPADRSVSMHLTTKTGLAWQLDHASLSLANGRWLTQPTETVTATSAGKLSCAATNRTAPLTGSALYRLPHTDQSIRLVWSNPPTGANIYTITTSKDVTATLPGDTIPIPGNTTQTTQGEQAPTPATDAHAILDVTMSSSVQRTLALHVHDATHDTWNGRITDSDNCTAVPPDTPSPPITLGHPTTYTLRAGDISKPMTGTLKLTTGDSGQSKSVDVVFAAQADNSITLKTGSASTNPYVTLDKGDGSPQQLTQTEVSLPKAMQAHATLQLADTQHSTVSVRLINNLGRALHLQGQPTLKNGLRISPAEPPAYLQPHSEAPVRYAVDNPSQPLEGSMTYKISDATGTAAIEITTAFTLTKPPSQGPPAISMSITVPSTAVITTQGLKTTSGG